jgi:MFS family permease
MVERATFAPVLQNRGFLNLWVNQIFVQLCYQVLNFTLLVWVFQLTNSSLSVAFLMSAVYLPAIILGLFTGILVDLTDKRRIIMIINICLSLLFLSLIFFKFNLAGILFIAFLINSLGQFYAPTESSAIPLIVKKNQLIAANSIISATLYSCFLIGFAIAGPLFSVFGIDSVFIVGSILLMIAFILSFLFPKISVKQDQRGKKLILALQEKKFSDIKQIGTEEILETVKLIKGKLSVFTSIMILAGIQMMIGILAVLISPYLERTMRIKAEDASYILIVPLGIGIITGGFILGKIGMRFVKRILVSWAIIFCGAIFLIAAIAPAIMPAVKYFTHKPLPFLTQIPLSSVMITGSFLLGVALVAILVPTQTVLQENTPDNDRGKVFSTLGFAMSAFSLIPVILSGILSDIFGVLPIFFVLGILIIVLGVFGLNPAIFLKKDKLPLNIKEFLGTGHWDEKVKS